MDSEDTGSGAATLASPGQGEASEPGEASEQGEPGGTSDGVAMLTPVEHLIRVSMALRGIRPSLEDMAAVEANPTAIDEIVDTYLASPRFGETIRDMHNDALLALADYLLYPAGFPPLGELAEEELYRLNRDVMEAPLRLVEHVVMNDLPYSEIVTADYTVANASVATIWGLPYTEDGPAWQTTKWEDGRGNAGILSDSWLFQRHSSTLSNANRGRANAMSKALLCHDFFRVISTSTPVSTSPTPRR